MFEAWRAVLLVVGVVVLAAVVGAWASRAAPSQDSEAQRATHEQKLLSLRGGHRIIYDGVAYAVESQTVVHGMQQGRCYRIGLKGDAGKFTMLYIQADPSDPSGKIRAAWMAVPVNVVFTLDGSRGLTWQARRFVQMGQGSSIHYYPKGQDHQAEYKFIELRAQDGRSPEMIHGEQTTGAAWEVYARYNVDPADIKMSG